MTLRPPAQHSDDEGRGEVSSTRRATAREERPSIGELVSSLSEKMSALVRSEIQLAKTELSTKAKHAGVAIALFVVAGLLAFYGLGVLIASAILGLSNALSPWLAALIVAAVLFLFALILGLVGKKKLDRGMPPTPERAQENIRLDVQAVKEGLNS
jgi:uncharacterized membrane protein YqjE